MSAVTLHRIDAARRMSRFYRLDVQPDLFGQWCFMREWGRIGRGGQMRETPYPTPSEAEAALARQRRHQSGKRKAVVIIRERNGRTLPAVFRTEG